MLAWISLALAGPPIVVLRSDSLPAYDVPVQRIVATAGVPVQVIDLEGDRAKADATMARLAQDPPGVVVAFGARAAWSAQNGLPSVPLVYAMVNDPDKYGIGGNNVTGVSTEVPADALMAQLQLFAPNVRKIGLILDSTNDAVEVKESMRAAEAAGFQLKALRVSSPRDVKGAFQRLEGEVDALWLVPDPVVITPESFRWLKEETTRVGMPMIASSELLVQAGALMCVAPDAAVVGEQAAALANRILQGTSPSEIPVEAPLAQRVVLNDATRRAIGLEVDPMMLDFVDEVVARSEER